MVNRSSRFGWIRVQAGVCCGPCNPSKWKADIWGWIDVRRSALLHFNKRQRPHWACRQYGHTGWTWGWLGVERWQVCLGDTSRSTKYHCRAAVGHWISLCVKCEGWLIAYQLSKLSLSCSQYSQTVCWRGWDDNACLGVRNTCSLGAWPNSLAWRPLWHSTVSPLLQKNKQESKIMVNRSSRLWWLGVYDYGESEFQILANKSSTLFLFILFSKTLNDCNFRKGQTFWWIEVPDYGE